MVWLPVTTPIVRSEIMRSERLKRRAQAVRPYVNTPLRIHIVALYFIPWMTSQLPCMLA